MTLTAMPKPCGSCPYRRDVPSGIWHESEYEKLKSYDGPTWGQSPATFGCHQQNGCLCSGWLACHGPNELLAVRIAASFGNVEPAVFDYETDVPVFASGAEAAEHGMREIDAPSKRATKMSAGIVRKNERACQCG